MTADPLLAAALAHVDRVVRTSGSSFALGMQSLAPDRRQAIYAVYAFGREVDDVADGPEPPEHKLRVLDDWRAEVERLYLGRPRFPTTRALAAPIRRYALPKAEFLGLIDGMEMDAREQMRAPDQETLMLYCRRVAGTVGLLSLPLFGATEPAASQFGLALADGLQLTNILRDIAEDADRERLYLPAELLVRHGIDPEMPVAAVLRHPALPQVAADLAGFARRRFADADRSLTACNRRTLRPALLMMGIYVGILDRLERRGWHCLEPLKMAKVEKLWAAFTKGLWRPAWRPST